MLWALREHGSSTGVGKEECQQAAKGEGGPAAFCCLC